MIEHWITAKNHEKYEVSNLGQVRNKKTGLILKPVLSRENGYYRVNIDGKHQAVHRLVADSFFDGEHDGMDVNHIDGDKSNNMIANLEWCTRQRNIRHAFDNGLKFASTVRVVRCRFCKHRYTKDICEDKPDSFFCSYGERR